MHVFLVSAAPRTTTQFAVEIRKTSLLHCKDHNGVMAETNTHTLILTIVWCFFLLVLSLQDFSFTMELFYLFFCTYLFLFNYLYVYEKVLQ